MKRPGKPSSRKPRRSADRAQRERKLVDLVLRLDPLAHDAAITILDAVGRADRRRARQIVEAAGTFVAFAPQYRRRRAVRR